MFTMQDWDNVVALKNKLIDEQGYEAEEAEQEAAEQLGFDYDDVLEFLEDAF